MEKKVINIDSTHYETFLPKKYLLRKKYAPENPHHLVSIIPGVVNEIFVKEGQWVKEGDKLLILEAMKMKNIIRAPRNARIKKIAAELGKQVAKDGLLIDFEFE